MKNPFYLKGLNFQCTRCSYCCRHTPGYVFLSRRDIERLGKALKMDFDAVLKKYCRKVNLNGLKKISLKEKVNFDCIFWEEDGCIIYEARPLQCRSFPFWSSNLYSRKTWDDLSKTCPGINQGVLHKKEEIDYWLKKRLQESSLILD